MISITSLLLILYSQFYKIGDIFGDKRFLKRIRNSFFIWITIFIILCIFHNHVLDFFWNPIKEYVKYSGNKIHQSSWEKPWFNNLWIILHSSLWLSFPFILSIILNIHCDLSGKKITTIKMSSNPVVVSFILMWFLSGIGFLYGINQFDDYFKMNQITNSDFTEWKPDIKECLIWYMRLGVTWILILIIPVLSFILERFNIDIKFQKYLPVVIIILMFDYYKISYEFFKYSIIMSLELLLFAFIWTRLGSVIDGYVIRNVKILPLEDSLKRIKSQKEWTGPNGRLK